MKSFDFQIALLIRSPAIFQNTIQDDKGVLLASEWIELMLCGAIETASIIGLDSYFNFTADILK